MGMMNDTVTVFNRYTEDNTEKWKRTVLRGVYWNDVEGAVLRKTGAASAASAVIIVPRAVNPGFVGPKSWAALEDKTRFWTLQAGDTVVRGEVRKEIARSAARELSDLDDVLTIVTVDDKNFGRLAHWEVSAK